MVESFGMVVLGSVMVERLVRERELVEGLFATGGLRGNGSLKLTFFSFMGG